MRSTRGERTFYLFNYLLLTLAGILCLLPLLHLASLSLSGKNAVLSGFVSLWPREITFESYKLLFEGTPILRSFGNSVLITVVGVAMSMVVTICAAYPLARREFYGRRWISLAIVFTMLFTGGLIPTYLVVSSLGLVNNYGSLWLPALVSTYNMMIMRSFFENIPEELVEAARIDGSGEWRLLLRIVLPLSLPVLATIGLFYAVYYWNSFFNVMIYINSPEKLNLTVLIQQMVRSQSVLQEINTMDTQQVSNITPEGIKAAGIMVMIVPMLVVYPLLQRYFVKGVTLGAIKG